MSFLLAHYSDEWNPTSQSDGDAGENAANDVDEEVHGNDGAERHEAQEASAGDRRAIADVDEAGQLDITGETRTARRLRTPEAPTDAVRMAHNATHVPFGDWCPICVASRGRNFPHRRDSCGEQDSGYSAEVPDGLTTCSFERWHRANLCHASHSWKRAVEW